MRSIVTASKEKVYKIDHLSSMTSSPGGTMANENPSSLDHRYRLFGTSGSMLMMMSVEAPEN